MSDFDDNDDAREIRREFRDVPTSKEHGRWICYADVVIWLAKYLTATADKDEWDQAEELIARKCEAGELVCWGYIAAEQRAKRSPIPSEYWPDLFISMLDGQPDHDSRERGGRMYGEAYWVDTSDAERLALAWTGLCFLKTDVLRHWPQDGRSHRLIPEDPNLRNATTEGPPHSEHLQRKRRGRPAGIGMFVRGDERLLNKMEKLIRDEKVPSLMAAARAVAEGAPGASEEAILRRLRHKYSKSGREWPGGK